MKKKSKSEYSNLQKNIRQLVIKNSLKTIENIYSDRRFTVELTTHELTTICPKTGLPDFATLTIRYIPKDFLVEEKSLKLYLNSYRNLGIFQENATNKIFEDFLDTVKPIALYIKATWNKRGGIGVSVERKFGNFLEGEKNGFN